MSTKEVRFENRSRQKNKTIEQTPCSKFAENFYGTRSRSTSSKKTQEYPYPTPATAKSGKYVTIINSYDIVRSSKKKHQESPEELSNEDEEEEDDDEEEEEPTESNEESTQTENNSDEDEIQECVLKVDENCNKILTGRDLIDIFYSFSEWFNGLKGTITKISSTTYEPSSKSPPVKKTRSPRSSSCPSKTKIFFDSVEMVTGNLAKDKNLHLRYDPGDQAKAWNECDLNKVKKFICFIEKKACFYDRLDIVPGIGVAYSERLKEYIPNFGTLLELFLTVDESTFKALLKCYSRIKSTDMNYIFTSCKKYFKKFGFKFNDVVVKTPEKSKCTKLNFDSAKRTLI
ncbi:unnamed protein product [Brachionus calyciflorus]|uniref:Uncharacterized protein n=1 Tax=Brachionus calyciflorus TaxID=104777 RepID=A0A813PPB5_9BILA|nr:unnamed protein product [Brachionus calyciflorus]